MPAGIAFGLAAGAAVILQLSALAAAAPEGSAEILWMLGWALAVCSAIAVVVACVGLVRGRGHGIAIAARAPLPSLALVTAAVALLALTFILHPFIGTGGGVG